MVCYRFGRPHRPPLGRPNRRADRRAASPAIPTTIRASLTKQRTGYNRQRRRDRCGQWRADRGLTSPVRVFARSFFSPDGLWLATVTQLRKPTDESPSFIELSQWDLQNAVRISGPIEVSLGRKLPETGYPASWLESGRSMVIGPDLAWQCGLPCAAESILPFLRACRPADFGRNWGTNRQQQLLVRVSEPEKVLPPRRTKQNQTAYDLAERVLKRSGNGLPNSERLSP